MTWRKLGRVYCPDGSRSWARSYALIPTAEVIGSDVIRLYYASVDDDKFGRVGVLELDARNPLRILSDRDTPVLDLGELGCFDDCGVNPSAIVQTEWGTALYYIGWQRCERVPYTLFAGMALRQEDGTFKRFSRSPILDRTDKEPFIRSAVTIIREGDQFLCWYVSADRWTVVNGRSYPQYVIRHTRSRDGVNWSGETSDAIGFGSEDEFGFGRPWVLKDGELYRMWYSIRSRSEPYKLGYAESRDGMSWQRKDEAMTLRRGPEEWEAEMICYPCVVDACGARYLFYNGNSHGMTGFGVAVQE